MIIKDRFGFKFKKDFYNFVLEKAFKKKIDLDRLPLREYKFYINVLKIEFKRRKRKW